MLVVLIFLLREMELVVCNGRQLVSEPGLGLIIEMDKQLMAVSGNVIVQV